MTGRGSKVNLIGTPAPFLDFNEKCAKRLLERCRMLIVRKKSRIAAIDSHFHARKKFSKVKDPVSAFMRLQGYYRIDRSQIVNLLEYVLNDVKKIGFKTRLPNQLSFGLLHTSTARCGSITLRLVSLIRGLEQGHLTLIFLIRHCKQMLP